MSDTRYVVTITAHGLVGSGKSRVLAEIAVALKAAGCPVEYADQSSAAGARDEMRAEAAAGWQPPWPLVVLAEAPR